MWWGRRSGLGFAVAASTAAIDQASKLWLLYVFDIAAHVPVHLTPFLDLVLVWNKGISYGLFQQDGALGQWILIAIKAAAVEAATAKPRPERRPHHIVPTPQPYAVPPIRAAPARRVARRPDSPDRSPRW